MCVCQQNQEASFPLLLWWLGSFKLQGQQRETQRSSASGWNNWVLSEWFVLQMYPISSWGCEIGNLVSSHTFPSCSLCHSPPCIHPGSSSCSSNPKKPPSTLPVCILDRCAPCVSCISLIPALCPVVMALPFACPNLTCPKTPPPGSLL